MTEAKRCRLYERDFVYTPACNTNIRARFDAVRAQLAQKAEAEKPANVKQIRRKA